MPDVFHKGRISRRDESRLHTRHLIWQQIDYVKPLYEFKDRIFHMHLKDLKINRERLADRKNAIYLSHRYLSQFIAGDMEA